jgi:transposase
MFEHPQLRELLKPPVEIALEASGGWYWVVDGLEKMGAKVHLAHPLKTKLIAESKVKTDKIDAQALYDLLRTEFLPESYIASREVREAREIHRHRAALVKIRTSVKNRIHSLLTKHGIFLSLTDIFGVEGRKSLEKIKSELRPVYKEELKRYLALIDWLNREIKKIEKKIRSLVEDNTLSKLLMTIPGIKYYSAQLILSEIGDINRFSRPKKLISYAGLNPGISQSGKHFHNLPITKQGNVWLRWILIQNAPHAARSDARLGRIYHRIAKRRGNNTAKVAVAREMLQAIYYVLKKKEPYCPKSATPVVTMVS